MWLETSQEIVTEQKALTPWAPSSWDAYHQILKEFDFYTGND
jgi:hypothetical protein